MDMREYYSLCAAVSAAFLNLRNFGRQVQFPFELMREIEGLQTRFEEFDTERDFPEDPRYILVTLRSLQRGLVESMFTCLFCYY